MTRIHVNQRALLCKPSRDEDSRKPRALLCKPSRDEDSRKPRAFMQNRTDIHGNPNIELVWYSLRKGRKKENCEETDKKQKMDEHDMDRQRLIKLAHPSTSHFTPLPTVGQPTPPPTPPDLPPPPLRTSSAGIWRSNFAPNRDHPWDQGRMDPHSACSSHASDTGCDHQ